MIKGTSGQIKNMSQLKLIQHPMGILVVSHYTLCINLKEKPQLVFDGYVQYTFASTVQYFCTSKIKH